MDDCTHPIEFVAKYMRTKGRNLLLSVTRIRSSAVARLLTQAAESIMSNFGCLVHSLERKAESPQLKHYC
jgi:hypothetical protein